MRSRFILLWVVAAFAAIALVVAPTAHVAHASASGVVISAVYTGGNRTGASYTHDYIEIFNAGAAPANITGWSVQYRHAEAASSWQKTQISATTTLQPGQYYLIQASQDVTGGGVALPTPDNTNAANMRAAGNVVVALMSTLDTIVGDDPRTDLNSMDDIEDLFGAGDATNTLPSVFEGSVRTGLLSPTTAWFRNNGGCQDTDNNLNDFASGNVAGMARNTATTLAPCAPTADLVVAVTDAPDPVLTGAAITYTVDVDNVGAAAANNAVISVALTGSAYPSTISGLVAPECSFNDPSDTITCNVASIASSGSFTFTFQVTPAISGTVTANATVSADAPETAGNNTGSASTTVSIPTGATGTIDSTATIVSGGSVTVTVTDADLTAAASVSVTAVGTSGDSETLSLPVTGTPGTFSASFVVANTAPTTGNSALEEVDGTITFTYVDALDAEGDVNSNRTDTTNVDPFVVTGATGTIDSTATITSGDSVTVTVVDADLTAAASVSVNAVGTSGDSESLTLNVTATPGTFSGTFTVANSAATASNGTLEEVDGTITFTYVDALDAEGDVNSNRTDTTNVDPFVVTGATGTIDSTATITSGDSVTVTVVDADLVAAASVTVNAVGTSGDNETLTLNVTATPGTFSGTFTVADAAPVVTNGTLEEAGGTITFTYVDALDAEGDVNTSLSDVTTVNAVVPAVGSFELVSPDEGDILRTSTTIFTWTEASGATSYDIFVSHLSTNTRIGETYTDTVSTAACTSGLCSWASTELVANLEQGTYSWTVIASNGSEEVEASNGPNLFTVDADGIELVVNGGLEDSTTRWTFSAGAKRKCAGFGDGSNCGFKLLPKATAQQNLPGVTFAAMDTAAGDVLQVSAAVRTNKINKQRVVMVVIKYVDPAAGNNGKDKFKLFVEQATAGYDTFTENFVLDGAIKNGRVVVANTLTAGTLRVDDVSVVLMPIGTTPRAEAPASVDSVLPVPAAPDNFRGNN